MNVNDLVKYLTVQLVEKINQPKEKKSENRAGKEEMSYSSRWFGLIPFSIRMFTKRFQKKW